MSAESLGAAVCSLCKDRHFPVYFFYFLSIMVVDSFHFFLSDPFFSARDENLWLLLHCNRACRVMSNTQNEMELLDTVFLFSFRRHTMLDIR